MSKRAPTAPYRVAQPLRCNGERYAIGDTVELTAGQAAQALASGSITVLDVLDEDAPPPAPPAPPATTGKGKR